MSLHKIRSQKRMREGYLLFLPVLIFLIAVFIFPLLVIIKQSFFQLDFRTRSEVFVGFKNYLDLLSDQLVRTSLMNAMVFTFTTILLHITFGWLIAMLLMRAWPVEILRSFFKSIILIPWIFSAPAAALIFKILYQPQGFFNFYLSVLFETRVGFLSDPGIALFSLLAINAWKDFVMYMILLLGGLQRIPESLYESARLDGCNAFQSFRYITFPLMKYLTVILILIDFVTTVNHFDLVWVMTKGGPLQSTYLPGFLIYEKGIQRFDMGFASSMSMLMVFIVLIVMGLYLLITRENEEYV